MNGYPEQALTWPNAAPPSEASFSKQARMGFQVASLRSLSNLGLGVWNPEANSWENPRRHQLSRWIVPLILEGVAREQRRPNIAEIDIALESEYLLISLPVAIVIAPSRCESLDRAAQRQACNPEAAETPDQEFRPPTERLSVLHHLFTSSGFQSIDSLLLKMLHVGATSILPPL